MKIYQFLAGSLLAFPLLIGASGVLAGEFKLNSENTKIKFVGSKSDGKHEGGFGKFSGSFKVDGDITKAQLQVTIEIDSITTDTAKLTAHLKSPDFFDAKRFPEAKFVSTGIKSSPDGYTVTGNLTMHGKTHSLSFPAKISVANGTL